MMYIEIVYIICLLICRIKYPLSLVKSCEMGQNFLHQQVSFHEKFRFKSRTLMDMYNNLSILDPVQTNKHSLPQKGNILIVSRELKNLFK